MTVAPLPRRGGVHWDARDEGRALRVTGHPETGSVVLSLWREDKCVATHHISVSDVPELIRILASALVEPAAQRRPTGT